MNRFVGFSPEVGTDDGAEGGGGSGEAVVSAIVAVLLRPRHVPAPVVPPTRTVWELYWREILMTGGVVLGLLLLTAFLAWRPVVGGLTNAGLCGCPDEERPKKACCNTTSGLVLARTGDCGESSAACTPNAAGCTCGGRSGRRRRGSSSTCPRTATTSSRSTRTDPCRCSEPPAH